MLQKLLALYIESLKIHIWTKTQDLVFHRFSEEVYNKLFDTFHLLAEKLEDLDKGQYYSSLQGSKNRLYDIVEEVKALVDGEKDKQTSWYDNLVRTLVDDLENLCWSARGFYEEEETDEEETETPTTKKLI